LANGEEVEDRRRRLDAKRTPEEKRAGQHASAMAGGEDLHPAAPRTAWHRANRQRKEYRNERKEKERNKRVIRKRRLEQMKKRHSKKQAGFDIYDDSEDEYDDDEDGLGHDQEFDDLYAKHFRKLEEAEDEEEAEDDDAYDNSEFVVVDAQGATLSKDESRRRMQEHDLDPETAAYLTMFDVEDQGESDTDPNVRNLHAKARFAHDRSRRVNRKRQLREESRKLAMKFKWQDELQAIKHSYGLNLDQENTALAIHKRLLDERTFNEQLNQYDESLE
jgi:hypothetical protein